MGMANSYLIMETFTEENIKWEDSMEKANTFGKLVHLMMEISYKAEEKE